MILSNDSGQLVLSDDNGQPNLSLTQSRSFPRRQRFQNVWVLGAGIVLLLTASAVLQAIGYVASGLTMPDVVTAAPALLAILLSLPTVLSKAPFRRWSAFAISFGVTLLVYLIALALYGFEAEGFKTVLQIALAIGCTFVGFATGLEERSRRFIDNAIVATCIALSLFLILVMLVVPHGLFRPKNIVGSELMYLSLLLVAARYDCTRKLGSIRLLSVLLIGCGLVSGHRAVLGLGAAAFVLDRLLPHFRSSFIHRSVVLATCGISVFTVFMYLNINTLPIFYKWNLLAQKYTGRQVSSGRQLIWPSLWEEIQKAPVFGHGFSVAASLITGQNLSTHNAFFMILLQVGWVGLVPVLCILFALAWTGLSGQYTHWRTLFTIALVMVIINSTFETQLIQNNLRVSVLLWLALGFIYSRIRFAKEPPQAPRRGEDRIDPKNHAAAKERLDRFNSEGQQWIELTGSAECAQSRCTERAAVLTSPPMVLQSRSGRANRERVSQPSIQLRLPRIGQSMAAVPMSDVRWVGSTDYGTGTQYKKRPHIESRNG